MSLSNEPAGTSNYPGAAGSTSGAELLSPPPPPPPVPLPPRQEPSYRLRESKTAFLTTEFYAYLATVAAIVIASIYFNADGAEPDEFTADQALRYISWVTIGYMISRGLAKAGRSHVSDSSDR